MQIVKDRQLIQDKAIAIIGGGPGGLTLARLLQLKGANVKVYERDYNQSARVQGAIVDLHFDSGLKVMAAAALMDAFKTHYMPGADKYRLLDKDGNICMDEVGQLSEVTFGDEQFRPEIDRGALRDMLIDALQPGTVIWDSQFISMVRLNGRWELTFKNGTIATADIVIGADGYRSKIRPYLTPITAKYSGATIIQGEVDNPQTECPEIYALLANANLMAMGDGKTIAAQPRGDGGLTFYAASLYPEDWVDTCGIDFDDSQAVAAYLKEAHAQWSPVFFTLFDASRQFVPRPLNYFPLNQQWEAQPDLTLLGDAAHLMPPSGEGVNTAMLDALDLSECLTSGEYQDLQTAIAAYEKQMLARAALLGKEAIEGIKDFAAPTDESVQQFKALLSPNE
ncbi:FAD-dependent monooxygenase [Chitinophaga pendula]|uniref:FAD-dependent oxidoreductase n=1 Tax=Chitinophaga TaxID=79328 RepID=UPI000BB014FE|nr:MULTISPECIES: NAD(P)/FAD-dependent oxidoreductase [Chitinophaga]ASZ12487.1 2-polyprenyl-6-methoxyphenol hydroxylase [Chitinophaga sp. MD30]UCJ09912.1 FAD-dependent monooxygenase [Chitinophaga pendula]